MEKIAVFPGTFDPITLGHTDVLHRALPLMDKIIVGIGVNAEKSTMFSLQQRENWIKKSFSGNKKVEVTTYEGLTTAFCKSVGAQFILRGIRTVKDFEYEKMIADMNKNLSAEIETILLFSAPQYSTLAATLVRDVYRNGGDISSFLPQVVMEDLKGKSFIET